MLLQVRVRRQTLARVAFWARAAAAAEVQKGPGRRGPDAGDGRQATAATTGPRRPGNREHPAAGRAPALASSAPRRSPARLYRAPASPRSDDPGPTRGHTRRDTRTLRDPAALRTLVVEIALQPERIAHS